MFERNVCLGGHAVRVLGETEPAEQIIGFMFDDIPEEEFEEPEAEFTLKPIKDAWEVIKEGKQVYRRSSLTDTANFLMGEVVFPLIENNRNYMAIHAALLSDERGGILIPGESGNGKSSLAIWLTKNGYHYHTDELVLVKSGSLETRVFTRPFNIKVHGVEAIDNLIDLETMKPEPSRGDFITMIPHRALNPDFIQKSPDISRILFPKYTQGGENTFTALSPAAAGIELMKTHVIARNLPGHGFEQLLEIVKNVRAYKLQYNHFDVLPGLLKDL